MTDKRAKALEALDTMARLWPTSDHIDAWKSEFETIREALSEPKWKTMESAPRDGRNFLGWNENQHVMYVAWFDKIHGYFKYTGGHYSQGTHWMPLPDAPTGEKS